MLQRPRYRHHGPSIHPTSLYHSLSVSTLVFLNLDAACVRRCAQVCLVWYPAGVQPAGGPGCLRAQPRPPPLRQGGVVR